jgi:hypothetical protein
MISMLPESHELHIPTHEPDYTDWKLDQPPVKIVEYPNLLADVVTRIILMLMLDVERVRREVLTVARPPIAHVL